MIVRDKLRRLLFHLPLSRPPQHGFHVLSLARDWQFWSIIYPQIHVVWVLSVELAGVSSLCHCAPSTSLASLSAGRFITCVIIILDELYLKAGPSLMCIPKHGSSQDLSLIHVFIVLLEPSRTNFARF
jgi:hypothetical protein